MAGKRLNEIRKIRKERVKKLRELGINPYTAKVPETPTKINKAREMHGEKVSVAGRLMALREHGNVMFADLQDESAKIQLLFQKRNLGDGFKTLKLFDIGDFVWVKGDVTKTQAGELTVDVENYKLLTKSIRPLPSTWHGLKDVEERYRQRYVDLILNPETKDVFEKRAKIVSLLRTYLDKKGFVEVKTPSLQPIYGGATAKPFITHHNALDIDLYLRISDELYLKRLIVGGFERVYELGTDFRNEGIDRWHNPEFSMLEFYWAYADYNDLMDMTEDMLSSIVKDVAGHTKVKYGEDKVDFKKPWKRITYKEIFQEKLGIDIDVMTETKELEKIIKDKKIKINKKEAGDVPSLLDAIYKSEIRPTLIAPTFITEHPFSMRPLAKRKEGEETKVESLQLIVAGAELINAYSELNDPADQKKRWEEDMERSKKGVEEYQVIDEDYIRALEYGMPPTAGWGLGIDRFTAILTNQHSLKDTILFPTLKPEK